MPLTLPLENQAYAAVRILVRNGFGSGSGGNMAMSAPDWVKLPMQKVGQQRHGFELLDCDRGALPYVGRARFKLEFGRFSDGLIGAGTVSDGGWDSDTDFLNINDLQGWEVRIQFGTATTDGSDPSDWATGWWGTVEYQEDGGWPGSPIPAGVRYYHCVDGLNRAGRWQMAVHGFHDSSDSLETTYAPVRGAMGYNTPVDRDAITSKNFSPYTWVTSGSATVFCHTHAGRGASAWTAQTAAEHALASNRPAGEPLFTFSGDTPLLAGVANWQVKDGDSALDVVTDICRRERGRGLVKVDWTESDPEGALTVTLKVYPQLVGDLTYDDPTTTPATTTTVYGATTLATDVAVDLIGDHRGVAEQFKLGDPYQHRFDYLETFGEPIEVLATLAYVDAPLSSSLDGYALCRRWTTTEQTSFRALTSASDIVKRAAERWRPVYQLHGLRFNWAGLAGDGNAGASVSLTRVDYRCSDSGALSVPSTAAVNDTSPPLVKLMSDLPLFEGYDYTTATPTRYDAAAYDQNAQSRRRMMLLVRKSADRYLTSEQTTARVALECDGQDLWISHSEDQGSTTRFFSDTSASGATALSAAFNYQQIVLTVGLRLPHRVRFASGDATLGRKRGQLYHKDYHLWIASPGAIWEVDMATGSASAGYAGKRRACAGTTSAPGILRDDRAGLAALHALSWAWYGNGNDPTNPTVRRSATWALRCCGLLPSFQAYDGLSVPTDGSSPTTVAYPQLGELVTTLAANGETHDVNTPVTRIAYDHVTGTTTWSSEWSELDTER